MRSTLPIFAPTISIPTTRLCGGKSGVIVVKLLIIYVCFAIFPYSHKLFAAEPKEPVTVIVLPLELSRAGAYSYLNESINQLLITRLSREERLRVSPAELSPAVIEEIRSGLRGADPGQTVTQVAGDWLIDGVAYSVESALHIDLTCYPAAPGGTPLSFGIKAEKPDDVIPDMTELAKEVGDGLLGGEAQAIEQERQASRDDDAVSGFQTAHPERAYKKGLYGGATLFGGDDERFQSKGVRKSGSFPITVESMALGDLDGDGVKELVGASRSRLKLYHYRQERFQLAAEYDFSPRIKIHMLNIADPGETGTMKLFVSADEGPLPSSSVFSWDGSDTLQPLQQGLHWYIRPVRWPGRGVVLAGQQASPNISDDFLQPSVYEISLNLTDGDIEPLKALELPEHTNLFDFAAADLNGNGRAEIMVIDAAQKLLVYDAGLNLVWVSSANYGGSNKYFGPTLGEKEGGTSTSLDEAQQSMRKLVYIPGRLDVKDITGDGVPEVIVGTNETGVTEYAINFRSFDGGAVACLSWRGAGLMELWRTNHITGYVADYAFDAQEVSEGEKATVLNRLFVAQIPDAALWEKILPGSDTSTILAYEMTVDKNK